MVLLDLTNHGVREINQILDIIVSISYWTANRLAYISERIEVIPLEQIASEKSKASIFDSIIEAIFALAKSFEEKVRLFEKILPVGEHRFGVAKNSVSGT